MPLTRTASSVFCPPSRPDPVEGEEDMETLLQKTESVSTVYAWPVYEVQSMVLPIPARTLTVNRDSSLEAMGSIDSDASEEGSRRRMCRTLRAEAECRERLAELLADDQSPSHCGDFSDDEWSPSYSKHPTSWEDASTDGETPAHLMSDYSFSEEEEGPMRQKSVVAVPGEGKKRWVDLFGDEETPPHEEATIHMNGYQVRPHGKKNWADLFEDEQTPSHEENPSDQFAAR